MALGARRRGVDAAVIKLVSQLRATRLAWGLSIDDLAAITGFGARTIYYWESREKTPSVGALIKWADSLGMDLEAVRRK